MRRDALVRRLLVLADGVAILAAFAVTALSSESVPRLMLVAVLATPLLLLSAKLKGLYDRDESVVHKTTLEETPKLVQLAVLGALITWLVGGGVVVRDGIDRREALLLWLALTVLLVTARVVGRALALRLAPVERCLVIGSAESVETIGSRLNHSGGVKAEMVAHLDPELAAPWSSDTCSPARLAEIRELACQMNVQRAIVAADWDAGADRGSETLNLLRSLKAVGVRVSVLPRLLEVVGSAVEFDDLHGVTVMGVKRFELTRSSAQLKRAFDLLGASLGMLAIAPAMIAIALAIKLDDGGPVLFRQARVGRHGQRFHMLKFRTMVPDAEVLKGTLREHNEAKGGLFKIAADPRVTRVGRFLRRTSLDELPQLLNIVKGQMSLVGPRPLVIEEDELIAGWHRRRLELMPGMTGPWQILGPARVPLDEMVAIDYLYVANWSLWGDIKILLRTAPHVLARRGL